MNTIHQGYRGLSLLMDLNWDRLLFVTALTAGLGAGAWLATLLA
ncbi:MAG: hypothetical protein V2I76_03860 [Roseobacter sp.]|jgi:hypothetical protein|nr:hypothetical protein [Roseobacter sp.]